MEEGGSSNALVTTTFITAIGAFCVALLAKIRGRPEKDSLAVAALKTAVDGLEAAFGIMQKDLEKCNTRHAQCTEELEKVRKEFRQEINQLMKGRVASYGEEE